MLLRLGHLQLMTGVVTLGIALAGVASAAPGDGVQLGNSTEFFPHLELGFRSRSNLTQSPDNPVAGVGFTVSPGARLVHDTPSSRVLLNGNYRLVKFFTRRLSGLDQFNDFDVSLDAQLFRQSPIGLVVSNRADLVNNNATDRVGNTPFVTRTRNDASAGFQIRPGSVLLMDLRGTYEYDDIRVPFGAIDSDTRGLNTRHGFGGRWDVEYRFFPRTSFVVEGNAGRYNWVNNVVERGASGRQFALPDSTQARVLTGLRGRISERLVTVLQVGYGVADYDVASVEASCPGGSADCSPSAEQPFDAKLSGLQRLLVVTQLSYELAEGRNLTIGYRKDFDDVFFTNYMAYHQLYASAGTNVGERIKLKGDVSMRLEAYRGALERNDTFLMAGAGGSYAFTDWVRLNLRGVYMQRAVPLAPEISFNDVRVDAVVVFSY